MRLIRKTRASSTLLAAMLLVVSSPAQADIGLPIGIKMQDMASSSDSERVCTESVLPNAGFFREVFIFCLLSGGHGSTHWRRQWQVAGASCRPHSAHSLQLLETRGSTLRILDLPPIVRSSFLSFGMAKQPFGTIFLPPTGVLRVACSVLTMGYPQCP